MQYFHFYSEATSPNIGHCVVTLTNRKGEYQKCGFRRTSSIRYALRRMGIKGAQQSILYKRIKYYLFIKKEAFGFSF